MGVKIFLWILQQHPASLHLFSSERTITIVFHVKKVKEANKRATTNEKYLTNQKECGAPPLEWRCYSEVGSWHLDSLCESQACSQPRKPRMTAKCCPHFNTSKCAHGFVCWGKPLSWNAKWSEGCWSHWAQATWRTEHNDWLRYCVHSTALHPDLRRHHIKPCEFKKPLWMLHINHSLKDKAPSIALSYLFKK